MAESILKIFFNFSRDNIIKYKYAKGERWKWSKKFLIPIYENYFRRNVRNNLWSISLRNRHWLSKCNIYGFYIRKIKWFVIIDLIWDNWVMFYHRTCDKNGFRPNGSSICHGISINMLPGKNSTGMLIRLRVGKWICVSKQFENTSKMCMR